MQVYDYVEAHTLGEQENEQIYVDGDYIEVRRAFEEDGAVFVRGWSHVSGDMVTVILEPYELVGLWGV